MSPSMRTRVSGPEISYGVISGDRLIRDIQHFLANGRQRVLGHVRDRLSRQKRVELGGESRIV